MLNSWSWFGDGQPALLGGLLIGIAAAGYFWSLGRIAGVSGMLGQVLLGRRGEGFALSAAMIAGLLTAGVIGYQCLDLPLPKVDAPVGLLLAGGLLVGFGTRLGNGCTSGHGVCGMARLSPRSLVATLVFMAAGFATVFILRHVVLPHVSGGQ